MMQRLSLFAIPCLWLGLAHTAGAGLIVSVGNLELSPGSSGFLDVTIESDGSDPLQRFDFQFLIEPDGNFNRLEFVDPQPDPQLGNSDYVFFGDSFKTTGIPPFLPGPLDVGTVSQTVVPNDTFTGNDFTASSGDVTLTGPKLLARLEVTADTVVVPDVGDRFTVSLVEVASSFKDAADNEIAFSSTSGTVSVVPEPSSMALLGIGAMSLLGYGWRRRHRRLRTER